MLIGGLTGVISNSDLSISWGVELTLINALPDKDFVQPAWGFKL